MQKKVFDFLYSLYLKFIGRDISNNLIEKDKFQKSTHAEIKLYQFTKLKAILINANETVPFYTLKFRELEFEPSKLESLEEFSNLNFYITKEDIRNNVELFISKSCDRSKLSWHRTGGSTGTPLHFATDRETDSGSLTSIMRSLQWFGTKFGRKHVIFWGSPSFVIRTPFDKIKSLGVTLRNRLMNRRFISNYDLNPENMHEYFLMIEKFKPEYIRGMASSLYIFSKFLIDNKLQFEDTNLKVIHSACEQLFDWQKEAIEAAFNVPVANTYGLSELCDVAYGAKCGHLHVSDEDVYLELVPFSSEGGEIVATQLNNFNCPLIRYRTGDIAEDLKVSSDCTIPLSIIHNLKGRAHDFIKGVNDQYVHGQFFTHLVVFEKGINKYQIIQRSLNKLTIKLITSNEYNKSKTESMLNTSIIQILGDKVDINYEYVDEIALTPSGKHRWIISEL